MRRAEPEQGARVCAIPRILVDRSQCWSAELDELLIAGWIVDPPVHPELRARVGVDVFPVALDRPDAQASGVEGAGAPLGFQVRVRGKPGAHAVHFEVKTDDGAWISSEAGHATFQCASLQASLDEPGDREIRAGVVRFAGWCLHSQHGIRDLHIRLDGELSRCRFGLGRDDVARAFPSIPASRHSGFEASLPVAPGRHRIALHAHLDDGSELEWEVPRVLVVKAPPVTERLFRRLARTGGSRELLFAGHLLARFRRWYGMHQRMPGRAEFRRLPEWLGRQYREYRVRSTTSELLTGFAVPARVDRYASWIASNRLTMSDASALKAEVRARGALLPLISVVMPVYNPPRAFFEAAVASLLAQIAGNWELCIADDASSASWLSARLDELQRQDARIKVMRRPVNGNISRASNSAAELATGAFLLLMDQDDLLAPEAIAEIACHLADHPDVDVLYSDDDKIDAAGNRFDPQFKPDWSPELLLSYMYMSHALCVRRTLFERVGGFRTGFEGSQDYDLALRVTEQARQIAHLPRMLYHWRVLPGSTALSGDEKPHSFEAGRLAVAEALMRRGGTCIDVHRPDWAEQARVGIYTHEFPDDGPSVAIIVPTRNNSRVLARCLASLETTLYRNREIVVVDNDSDDPETVAYLRSLRHRVLTIPRPGGRFSFSYVNNRAVEQVDAEYVLFLNDDTEVLRPEWLSQMIGYARLPGVGAVGARLLYDDGRIQHAGVVHGYYDGLVGPAFKLMPAASGGYLSYALVTRNYSAVTAACMLTPRRLFESLGGFDEKLFAVAYNDVDYCYRLGERGFRCVYVPRAELLHHEGTSRGFNDDPREVVNYRELYGKRVDPFYSPHLSLEDEQFRVRTWRRSRRGLERPIRAAMCAFNLNLEGAPYCQYELTIALVKRGVVDPTVYSPADGPLRALYEQAGIRVVIREHPLASALTADDYERAIGRFAAWLTEMRFELVYGNTLQTFYAMDGARIAGLPCIWNVRESEPWRTYFDFLPVPLRRKALQCFSYPGTVIFVANATRERFEELDSNNSFRVIHDGLDLDRLAKVAEGLTRSGARGRLGLNDGDVMILLVGTVCERKGQQDLAHAMGLLSDGVARRVRCFVVGDRPGHYSAALHRIVAALPRERAARFTIVGETDEVPLYYAAADVFVCTSRVESYPRVILEAMAFDLPIVTTPCFGIVEQVRPGVNADYYRAGDAQELALALERLADDPERMSRYRNAARLVFDGLTGFEDMADRYAQAFVETFQAGDVPYEQGSAGEPAGDVTSSGSGVLTVLGS